MVSRVEAFIARRWCAPPGGFRVDVQPLHGGLESAVARARVSAADVHAVMPRELVIKELPAGFEREADVYDALWRHLESPPAVRLFGREVAGRATYLYLEEAQASRSWPWAETLSAGAVCRALARLHDSRALPQDVFVWDYETGLARSAQSTLELARDARDTGGRRLWRRLGDLRRVVAALPRIRQRLLSGETSVIHGDMHPGNVILRGGANHAVAMIDWARSRMGSPLEDVASWLHSLGCWEPEARRRHDTLMRMYLDARRPRQVFSSSVRVDYWLASASNGLSGAIRYHLAVLADEGAADAVRYDSQRALIAWERVIRRAASLVSTNLERCTSGPSLAHRCSR